MIAKKIEKTEKFTIVDNEYLNDKNLSFKAKGILTYFLSLPGDWVIYFDEVITHSKDGIKSFRSGIDELIKEGYIRRYPVRENGAIIRWETEIYERKQGQDCQNVEEAKEDIGKFNLDKESLLNTKLPRTYENKDLSNYNRFDKIIHEWNKLGDRVIPMAEIRGDFLRMLKTDKLIEEFTYDEFIKTIRKVKTSKHAGRYQVRYEWFIDYKNFTKVREGK